MDRKTIKTIMAETPSDQSTTPEILTDLLGQSVRTSGASTGVIVGQLRGWTDAAAPLVDYPDHPAESPIPARSTVPLDQTSPDTPVVLVFEQDDPNRPIIIGVIQPPAQKTSVTVDGEAETILEGKERIELRCGKAKIVLTSDGKVLIKGTDIVSRSEGPNRIKGASIQIN